MTLVIKSEPEDSNDGCVDSPILSSQCKCDTKNLSKKSGDSGHIVTPLADLSNKGRAKTSELFTCIRKGHFEEFVDILESKPRPELNAFFDGNTALHYCLLMRRDISWCKQLVINGANPNLSNQDGWHPIHLAAHSGNPELMMYLLKCNNSRIL